MASFFEDVLRWQATARETQSLLSRNSELLAARASLLETALDELRDLHRLARQFTDGAARGQAPEARMTSARNK